LWRKEVFEMQDKAIYPPIPLEIALQLCAEVRRQAEQDWQSPVSRWCWACQQSTGGDPAKRGYLRQPGNRGCILVNARFAERNPLH